MLLLRQKAIVLALIICWCLLFLLNYCHWNFERSRDGLCHDVAWAQASFFARFAKLSSFATKISALVTPT